MLFEFYRFRFHFRATQAIYFPEYQAGNIIRGAFGVFFKSAACRPTCNDAKTCDARATCAYALAFEPKAAHPHGPSGLLDWPRPFVFRAAHLNSCRIRPGELFHFDVHSFNVRNPAIEFFAAAFRRLACAGFGPGRATAELLYVDQLDEAGSVITRISDFDRPQMGVWGPPIIHDLARDARGANCITIRLMTPTDLKCHKWRSGDFAFASLFARLRDRISTLRMLYGPGPLDIDFRAMAQRAEAITLVRSGFRRASVARHSSRSGQRHPIGGLIGDAEYEGELAEFVPYFLLGKWLGVGRHTVWGNGQIEVLETTAVEPQGSHHFSRST